MFLSAHAFSVIDALRVAQFMCAVTVGSVLAHSRSHAEPYVSFGHVVGETGGSGNTENRMS